jgi:hypothetical protein
MTNMDYSSFRGEWVTITLNTGEKVAGTITNCSDKLEYIELDGDSSTMKRIAKSQIAMVSKA